MYLTWSFLLCNHVPHLPFWCFFCIVWSPSKGVVLWFYSLLNDISFFSLFFSLLGNSFSKTFWIFCTWRFKVWSGCSDCHGSCLLSAASFEWDQRRTSWGTERFWKVICRPYKIRWSICFAIRSWQSTTARSACWFRLGGHPRRSFSDPHETWDVDSVKQVKWDISFPHFEVAFVYLHFWGFRSKRILLIVFPILHPPPSPLFSLQAIECRLEMER